MNKRVLAGFLLYENPLPHSDFNSKLSNLLKPYWWRRRNRKFTQNVDKIELKDFAMINVKVN